jgi:transporter family-2 protein
MYLIALLTAFAAGVLMAFQGSLNTGLGKIIGLLASTFFVHAIGTAAMTILLLIMKGESKAGKLTDVPWYLYLGGILSVVIIYAVATSISRIGVAAATTAIIVGQVGTALAIDHFGCFGLEKIPFTWIKAVGVACLALGGWLMLAK